MGKHWPVKLNNKGASLIAVLVAISVVSIMGIIITQLTVTNLQMKEVERQGKTNFYDAEHVMDDLTAGLNAIASTAMEKAYTDMLGQYRTVTADGSTAKQVFARMYLENLETEFATSDGSKVTMYKNDADGKTLYARGYYSISTIKTALQKNSLFGTDYTDDERDAIVTIVAPDPGATDSAEYFKADYTTGEFILEGICVSVKDDFGNKVSIKTDVVFHTPDLNLDGSNLVKEFMRYSLIADEKIRVNATDVKVDGNVYAGIGGIETAPNGTADFFGKKIITRGDIKVTSASRLTIGKESDLTRTQLWTKNIVTKRENGYAGVEANRAKLNLFGYMFVSDDLELNGAYDEVSLKGEYYGYNFQENYDAKDVALKDAEFSSAIVVNGRKSNLNLEGLTRLMIAGRTFIGRNAGTENVSDIAMGEALAVRTNQVAYFVPVNCIDLDAGTIDDDLFEAYSGVPSVSSYLKAGEPYTEFYYKQGAGAPEKIYYLNFANDQKANDFYTRYYSIKGNMMNFYAENYLHANAIKLSGDVVLLLQGDLLYRNGTTGFLNEYHTNIDSSNWDYGKLYYKFSSNHALMYQALQLTLEDKTTGLTADHARLVDEPANRMFQALIDEDALNALVTGPNATDTNKYVVTYTDPDGAISGTKILAIVKGDYVVDSTYTGGLVVATGNVSVQTGSGEDKFCGTIISKGIISFAANAEVASDEVLISQMISQDIRKTIPSFATIFNGYEASAEAAMGTATINKYLTYENWTKTYEN
ncbi:MAG: hypothetical protein IKS85_06425 [Lachnospiraceae bacterium]|nr:hypothetical protein [Lachnospiraceae bacterium]